VVPGASSGSSDDSAFGGRIDYPNDTWGVGLSQRATAPIQPRARLQSTARARTSSTATCALAGAPTASIRRIDLGGDETGPHLDGSVQTLEAALPPWSSEDRYGDVFNAELRSPRRADGALQYP